MFAGLSVRTADPRAVVGLVSGGHFLSHFYILVFPPLFPMLRDAFGLGPVHLGLIMSVVAIGMFLQVPAGWLVNQVGAKRVFVLGVTVTAGGIVAAGLAATYPLLLAAAFVSGIGQSAFHPSDYTLLDAVTDDGAEGKSFSVHTFGGYVGFAAAPVAVSSLAIAFDWRIALFAVGAVGLAYAGLAHLTMDTVHLGRLDEDGPEDADGGASEREIDGNDAGAAARLRGRIRSLLQPTIVALSGLFLGLVMGGKGIQTFTPLFVARTFDLTEVVGNSVLTVLFAATAVGVLGGGVLADRYDPYRITAASLLAAAGLTGILAAGPFEGTGVTVAFVTFGLLGFCYGLPLPARDRLVAAASSETAVGTNFGIVFTAAALGSLVSPALLGAIIEYAGTASALALVGVFFLAAAAVVVLLKAGVVGEGHARVEPGGAEQVDSETEAD